jgi:hypothetical protein
VFLVAEQSNGAPIQMPMPAVPAQSSNIQSSDENQLGAAVRPINDQLPAGLVFAYCFFCSFCHLEHIFCIHPILKAGKPDTIEITGLTMLTTIRN